VSLIAADAEGEAVSRYVSQRGGNDMNNDGGSQAEGNGGGKGYAAKMKSQLQKAVRRISAGGGSDSGSSSGYGSDAVIASTYAGGVRQPRRQSSERPGMSVRAPQPRTRHMSLQVDRCGDDQRLSCSLPQERIHHFRQYVSAYQTTFPRKFATTAQPPVMLIPDDEEEGEEQDGYEHCGHSRRRRERFHKAVSSPLPARRARRVSGCGRRASQPAGASPHSPPPDEDEEPPEYADASFLGPCSPFPCGSEAVMINSALAHDVFRERKLQQQQTLQHGDAVREKTMTFVGGE